MERLERRFADLVETCSKFSRELIRDAGWNGGSTAVLDPVAVNVDISRSVFGKWSLDILSLLYLQGPAGFQEIRRGLGRISSRVLSSKLTRMQETGLLVREVKPSRPPRVVYSLTDRGLTVAKLGEPVFLYLRLGTGLTARAGAVPIGSRVRAIVIFRLRRRALPDGAVFEYPSHRRSAGSARRPDSSFSTASWTSSRRRSFATWRASPQSSSRPTRAAASPREIRFP